jgi:hypothetical protein
MNEELQNRHPTEAEIKAEAAASRAADLDARILLALEHLPEVSIPVDFAARVAAKAPAVTTPAAIKPTHYGRNAMLAAMLVLLLALLAFAPRSVGGSHFWLALEWIFCAQFLALGVWFGIRPPRRE